jgi:ribosome-associated protein
MSARSSSTITTADSAKTSSDSLALVAKLVKALDGKKAGDLRVLSVGEHSSITDYLILASGQAHTHLRALRIEAERTLDEAGAPIAGVESGDESGWIVFDAYQIMIHLFMPEQREVYQLEQLWRDADDVDVEKLLNPPKPKAAAKPKTVTKKAAVKKTAVKKVSAKKAVPAKKVAKKAPVKKAAPKKVVSKKAAVKKTATKKTATKKTAVKKTAVKKKST